MRPRMILAKNSGVKSVALLRMPSVPNLCMVAPFELFNEYI